MSHKLKWGLAQLPIYIGLLIVVSPLDTTYYLIAVGLIIALSLMNYTEGITHPSRTIRKVYNITINGKIEEEQNNES